VNPVSQQPPYANAATTHVRWNVVAMLAVITGLTQIDRLNLQVAGKYIQDEYKFDTQTVGWVLGAFGLGYATFLVLGGWLEDRFGARHVLALTVLWSSVFTALEAFAPSLGTGWLSGRGRLPWCASCWVPGKRVRSRVQQDGQLLAGTERTRVRHKHIPGRGWRDCHDRSGID